MARSECGRFGGVDPVALVAAAVAAGATAGLTDTAKQGVLDSYQSLRGLITRRYRSVDVGVVEARPEAGSRRVVLAEELARAGAADDQELLTAAHHLLQLIEEHSPQAAQAVGVTLTRVRAGELKITDIESSGSGVIATDTTVSGTLKIEGLRAGVQEPPHPSQARR
ncbi:hypothetical protein ACIBJI_08250 [Nocardia sp. NPDC050408]|uniref:hypothetical protein n=1 Tax=unclassified Nocardia TaxID=2637762 RepID=UPI0034144312